MLNSSPAHSESNIYCKSGSVRVINILLKIFRWKSHATKKFTFKHYNILLLLKYKRTHPFVRKAKAIKKIAELSRINCIRGYHVYKDIWDATIEEVLYS